MDLKIGETARAVDVTSVTIRNWVEEFGEFLSPSAKQQRRKRFTPQDVDILLKIKSLRNDGFTYSEIPDQLNVVDDGEIFDYEEIQPEEQPPQPEQTNQQNALATIEVFDFITQSLNAQTEQHQREINAKDETIAILQDELERARLPWWKRLF